jgi:hypothetical protein
MTRLLHTGERAPPLFSCLSDLAQKARIEKRKL